MAESVIDSLLISIGLDAKELTSGIDRVRAQLGDFSTKAGKELGKIGNASQQAGSNSALSFDQSAERLRNLGQTGKEAAQAIGSSFKGLDPIINAFRTGIGQLVATLGLVTGSVATFSSYIDKADSLGKLSRDLGISVKELDAFGKAAQAAGGSAESMFASMRSFYEKTGRPAEEVFQLAKKVEGMSRGAAQRFLQAQGVATDAIPIFLQGQETLDKLMAKYRQTAFTEQVAKTARAFKVAWMDFKTAAQSVGNVLVRTVAPVLTKVVESLSGLIGIVQENIRFFGLMGAALGAVFAVKNLEAIKKAAVAIRAFGVAFKMAFLPLTAIVAGIAGLTLAIDDLIGFAEGADSIFGRMLKTFGMTDAEIESVRESFQSVGAAISEAWEVVKPWLGGALSAVFKGLAVAITVVVGAITGLIAGLVWLWNKIKDLKQAWDDWCAAAIGWLDDLTAKGKALGQSIADWFSGIPGAIADALASAWDIVVDWFSGWADLIAQKIGEPIKNAFKSVKSFFGFGKSSDEQNGGQVGAAVQSVRKFDGFGESRANPQASSAPIAAARSGETVAVRKSAMQSQSQNVVTTANMNVVNNIQTQDDPQAITRAVTNGMNTGFNKQAALIGQAMSGTNLKGG